MSSRSAVLAQGQHWSLALQDIQLSFEAGYPKGGHQQHLLDIQIVLLYQYVASADLAYKLHERRAKCFSGLGRNLDAATSYQEALAALADAKLDAEKKEKVEQGFRNSLNQLPSEDSPSAAKSLKLEESEELPSVARVNPRFPAFSDAIDLRIEPGRGRFGR